MSNGNLLNHHTANDDSNSDSHNESITTLRKRIIEALPDLASSEISSQWWLLGTTGCHLCDTAESLLMRLAAVQPITYHYIDIAELDESLMMQFATTIPVLLTPTQRLNYPFSVLDLQQLLV